MFSRHTLRTAELPWAGEIRFEAKRPYTSDDIDIIFNLSQSSHLLFSQPYDHGVGLDKLDFVYFTYMFMRMLRYFAFC